MKTALLDIDGVLAWFVKGAIEAHSLPVRPEQWTTWNHHRQFMSDRDFWAPLGEDFWAGLEFMPDAHAILNAVRVIFGDDILLCTSPCKTSGCGPGKMRWVERHLPEFANRTLLLSDKHRLALTGFVLIDDYEENVRKYTEAGGKAVLVPRPWNGKAGLDVVEAVMLQLEAVL